MPITVPTFDEYQFLLDRIDAHERASTDAHSRLTDQVGRLAATGALTDANLGEALAALTALTARVAALESGGDVALDGTKLPLVQPSHSQAVADSYGICGHVNFGTTVYGSTREWLELCDSTGARFFRSMYAHNLPANTTAITEARRLGLGWLATVTPEDWNQTPAELVARLNHIRDNAADVVVAIEGVNEPNHERSGGPPPADWAQRTLTVQRTIYEYVQTHMPHIKVVGPSLHATVSTGHQDQILLGQLGLGQYMDAAGLHRYFGGRYPDYLVDERIGWIRDAYGSDMPIWVTETGYTNCVNNTTQHKPVTEAVSAAYGPLTVLEFFSRGCNTTRYELLDDPDPEKNDVESNFGLWRVGSLSPSTWTEKPEAPAMRAFLTGLADPGLPFTPAPVRVAVTAPASVKSLVVGRRDGSTSMLLWQRADIWNPQTQQPINVAPADVTIKRPRRNITATVPAGQVVTVRM